MTTFAERTQDFYPNVNTEDGSKVRNVLDLEMQTYRSDIDGLRAIAVLSVIAFHAFPQAMPGGFTGVDIFFVISGFLISGILLDDLARGTFSLARFYARRIRRIVPALIVVATATFIVGCWGLFPESMIRLGQQMVASSAFAANIYFWQQSGYFSPAAGTYPLLHLWSLGIEEQFYIFWPIALLLLSRWPRGVFPVIIILAIGSIAAYLLAEDRTSAFYLPHERAWQLMIGAGAAWIIRHTSEVRHQWLYQTASAAGLTLILYSIFYIRNDFPYPGWHAFAPTFGSALILWGNLKSNAVSSLLSIRPLGAIGLISYPLYLWHWPVFWFARTIRSAEPGTLLKLQLCAISAVLAWATFKFVEHPIRYPKLGLSSPVRLKWLVAALLAVAVTGQIAAYNGLPARWPSDIISLLNYKFDFTSYRIGTCHLKPEQGPLEFGKGCFRKPVANEKSVVVVGDSVATALYPGIDALAQQGYSISELTASVCPPFFGNYETLPERPLCPAVNSFVLHYIKDNPPDIVILSTAPSYKTDIPTRISETVQVLRSAGVPRIIVVGPVPIWPKPVPELIIGRYLEARSNGPPASLPLPAEELLTMSNLDFRVSQAASSMGATYVSSLQQLCPRGICTVMIKGEPTVFDTLHLTLPGSLLIAPSVIVAMR